MRAARSARIALTLSALSVSVVAAAPAAAEITPAPHAQGNWSVGCPFVKRAPDDPIVLPGQPGRSHMHDFFGNPSVDAFSTEESLLAATAECTRAADRSAYWVPTLARGESVDASGQPTGIVPLRSSIYYLAGGRDPATLRPFPRGLRIVAGAPGSGAARDRTRVGWFCAFLGGPAPSTFAAEPPLCTPGQYLFARVIFPDCSDGRADSADHMRHMAYSSRPSRGAYRVCPRSHPIAVPAVRLTVSYRYESGLDSELSSGGRRSLHADFFASWRGRSVRRLIAACLREDLQCGARPAGSSR